MASDTKLNNVTLADPTTYTVQGVWLGGAVQLANGNLRRDLVNGSMKRRFSLAWVALSSAQLAAITSAFAAAVAGDVPFVGPDGTSCNVNAGMTPVLNYETFVVGGGALLYRCSLELWEA